MAQLFLGLDLTGSLRFSNLVKVRISSHHQALQRSGGKQISSLFVAVETGSSPNIDQGGMNIYTVEYPDNGALHRSSSKTTTSVCRNVPRSL